MIVLGTFLYCWCAFASGARLVELDHVYNNETATWPGEPKYQKTTESKGYTDKGYWHESYSVALAEHSGTHMDAPSHFGEGKWTMDQIPLERLFGPAVLMDISEKVTINPTAQLTADDVMSWLEKNGEIPDGAIVLVRTGWEKYYGNDTAYFGPESGNLSFPGISPGAANLLVDYERMRGHRVFGVGLDTPSLDHGPSTHFETHQILAKANIYGLENVANLELVPTKGGMLTVMPMKIEGGSGAPVRIVLTLPKANGASSFLQLPPVLMVSAVFLLVIVSNLC